MGNSMTDGSSLFLHGNKIATWNDNGYEPDTFSITNAGWPSVTTRERLNGLPGVHATQKNYEQILNGEPWGGQWVEINPDDL